MSLHHPPSGEAQLVRERAEEYRRRRDLVHPAVRDLAGVSCVRPAGAFYVFPNVSRLLSPGGSPTADPAVVDNLRQHDRSRLWSPTWDTHRVWLTGFTEENRAVKLSGDGRDADDVGELMRRMLLSLYFRDVRLDRTEEVRGPTGMPVHRFTITARARY